MTATNFVISGTGVVSSLGTDASSVLDAVLHGRRKRNDIDLLLRERLTRTQSRRLDRLSQLCVAAAQQAVAQARLNSGDRVGVVVGSGLGCLEKSERYLLGIADAGLAYANSLDFPDSMDIAAAGHCAIALGLRGPSLTVSQREVSGECAVILAALMLASGSADAVVVVAGDTVCVELDRLVHSVAPALTPTEAAGALVLETPESLALREASALGRLRGFAQTCEPDCRPSLRLARSEVVDRAFRDAITMAGVVAEDDTILLLPRDEISRRIGWCMGDGVLRALLAIEWTARDIHQAAVDVKAARGGMAAALVLAPASPES